VSKKGVGIEVRVYPDIERLVRYVADKLGYQPFVIRNIALLYGLMVLANSKKIPDNDNEFFRMIEVTKEMVIKVM